jgi:hypothetical protein
MIVLTQMHGLGLSLRLRWALAGAFVLGVGLFYALSGDFARINEVIRIPFIEYLAVFLFYGLFMAGYGLKRLLSPRLSYLESKP